MKGLIVTAVWACAPLVAFAETCDSVSSPDGRLTVSVYNDGGQPFYAVTYDGKTMLERSALGLKTNIGSFCSDITFAAVRRSAVDTTYTMRGTKASSARYAANILDIDCETADARRMTVTFSVSDNDIAFRYSFPAQGKTACMVVESECTAFRFPDSTTTFISPQSDAMGGWKRTKPSYEEVFSADAPMSSSSKYGQGYTFPCLFHVGDSGWALVSETGVNGTYVGAHLSDYDEQKGYTIAFPMEGEANGIGTSTAGVALPGATPWRTITVGADLKPILETTVTYDVVAPRYEPSCDYLPGRYTWSWIIWQDNSINYDDQVKFIDVAAEMGYEYCLVDCNWDVNIGRKRMEELSAYAQSRDVNLLLWYNSNGYANDAPYTPKNRMNTVLERRREMAWLQSIGVKGIKVDFFGGDKQQTMQLYEDILSDANDYGLQVIFHGCTLPRGWERMYPNYASSEAVLASENVYFGKEAAQREAFDLTLHPFCRNAVAAMDWGGTLMNRYMSKDNKSRHPRYTTNVFEMAAAIVNQSSLQCVAMQPNNLDDLTQDEIDFLRAVPAAWDETRYVSGYPGRYVVLARRSGERWIVAGLNAESDPLTLEIDVPMFAGKDVNVYVDKSGGTEIEAETTLQRKSVGKKGTIKVVMQSGGGLVICDSVK